MIASLPIHEPSSQTFCPSLQLVPSGDGVDEGQLGDSPSHMLLAWQPPLAMSPVRQRNPEWRGRQVVPLQQELAAAL